MVTPEITWCSSYTYDILNTNGTLIETKNLTLFNNDVYYFNLSLDEGNYVLRLCDGGTREIIVENDNEQYYLYVIALLVFFVLLGLGYYLKQEIFVIIAGMLSMIIAINIFFNGFPNLSNEFLRNGMVIVLAGIGMYFTLAPSIDFLENFGSARE
jgi:hypothetical protein